MGHRGTRLAIQAPARSRRVENEVGNMASLEQVIGQFRRMLPEESATARAIDRQEPWERIALNAVDDGYIEFANELGSFIEVCLRRSL